MRTIRMEELAIVVLVIARVGWAYFVNGGVHSQDAGAGLSQIDLESSKEITICTTQKKPLSCSYPGSNIAITGVFWGRKSASICPSDDGDTQLDCFTAPESEGIVKGRCEGKESCELEARHALLQNPGSQHCPGVNKYLTVNYTCIPDAKEEVMCDSENSSLTCPASWKIGVNSVFWGRQSTTVCPAENGQTMCTGAPESLGIVKKSCDGLTKCDIHASYDQVQNGAENCPGVQKYLIINYSCRPHPNIGTEEDVIQNDEPPVGKPNPGPSQNVASDLKQLDGGQVVKVPAEDSSNVVGENLNIGRLGMGGLKALEKINNLIKASAETQDNEEGGSDNGLTDEQAQAIERMIIEGIHHIKKDAPPGTGNQRASIPRQKNASNTIAIKALSKLRPAEKQKENQKTPAQKPIVPGKKDNKIFPTTVQVGDPKLQKVSLKDMSLNNQAEAKNAVNEEKGSILKESAQESGKVKAVVKDKFAEEKKKKSPAVNVHGLGLGIAGTGNSP
ncbi:uncharacterized protein [Montipora capricornis]|uniref:uncharacterized protein n=1 Tax=Montipora capricornis TaxID=246305 RepID=UPI0035F17641